MTKKPMKKPAKPAAKQVKPKPQPMSIVRAPMSHIHQRPAQNAPVVPENTPESRARKANEVQSVRGMKDILPEDQFYWEHIRNKGEELCAAYGYKFIETPILEYTDLFTRPLGKDSDVVEKEMYSFVDKGEERVSLRPEFTAGVVRSYVNHGMMNQPQPVKLFCHGPTFRYDRPQKGRYRQFHQFGMEVIGSALPIVDAELIVVMFNFFKEIGLTTHVILNSIGTSESRREYIAELGSYYRSKRAEICEDCKRRLLKNPLRLLDCKEPQCQPIKEAAPQIMDWLDEDSKAHFMKVLEYLDEVQIPYELNPKLVRGFDYYSRTVFEFVLDGGEDGAQTALGGGGRYDGLVEQLGGLPTPACGLGIGMERVILAMKEKNLPAPGPKRPRIFLAQLGEQARIKALGLFEEFRKAGIQVMQTFAKEGLKAQLEAANKYSVPYTLILGQKEVLDGTILIRDMDAGNQEVVDLKKIVTEVRKKLKLVTPEEEKESAS